VVACPLDEADGAAEWPAALLLAPPQAATSRVATRATFMGAET